jgi:hypothetical protein
LLDEVERVIKEGKDRLINRSNGVYTSVKIGNIAKLQMLRKGLLK